VLGEEMLHVHQLARWERRQRDFRASRSLSVWYSDMYCWFVNAYDDAYL
jgi:hypothetical protein